MMKRWKSEAAFLCMKNNLIIKICISFFLTWNTPSMQFPAVKNLLPGVDTVMVSNNKNTSEFPVYSPM